MHSTTIAITPIAIKIGIFANDEKIMNNIIIVIHILISLFKTIFNINPLDFLFSYFSYITYIALKKSF